MKTESARLFFTVTLPWEVQQAIISWRAEHFPESAGHPVSADQLHLTLAFLGEVSATTIQQLSERADKIRQSSFSLTLDDAGHWLRSGVIWIGCRQAPRGLLQLANLLRSYAAYSGCYQAPLPFHPHVSLYCHARHPVSLPALGFSWSFPVTTFSLMRFVSHKGKNRYQTLREWTLCSHNLEVN